MPTLTPCSVCGTKRQTGNGSLPPGEYTCRPCRRKRREREEAEKLANRKPCVVCGVTSLGGRWCAEHRGFAQCAYCTEWAYFHNPDRKNIFCSDECRAAAGFGRNGQPLKISSTALEWKQCICETWICQPGRKHCSDKCAQLVAGINSGSIRSNPACQRCGVRLPVGQWKRHCDACLDECKREARRQRKAEQGNHRKRARLYGVEYEPVNRKKVFIRDGWTCGICNEPVDGDLKYPDVMSASLDHIIPMSRGGGHTYENTQCAHWICNTLKSDKMPNAA